MSLVSTNIRRNLESILKVCYIFRREVWWCNSERNIRLYSAWGYDYISHYRPWELGQGGLQGEALPLFRAAVHLISPGSELVFLRSLISKTESEFNWVSWDLLFEVLIVGFWVMFSCVQLVIILRVLIQSFLCNSVMIQAQDCIHGMYICVCAFVYVHLWMPFV